MEMPKMNKPEAVIYVRVSSDKQVIQGHGLESQESRCRMYCKQQGYTVVAVFKEEGITGGRYDRPAYTAMLALLKERLNKTVVIFDNIDRIARSLDVFLKITRDLQELHIAWEIPSNRFDPGPAGTMATNMLAVVAQYHKEHNREMTTQKHICLSSQKG